MAFTNQIGSYQLIYYGTRSNNTSEIVRINLCNDINQLLGSLLFYRDSQALANNVSIETRNPKRAYLRIHERQLDSVVDTLRNEKPCSVYYSNPTTAFLYTGLEPVGEEESEE